MKKGDEVEEAHPTPVVDVDIFVGSFLKKCVSDKSISQPFDVHSNN
jgi:hypothetical protein